MGRRALAAVLVRLLNILSSSVSSTLVGVLILPACFVIGFGFAGAWIAAVTWMRSWQDFELINLVMLPMFLFATTFFPLSVYPEAIEWMAGVPAVPRDRADPRACERHRLVVWRLRTSPICWRWGRRDVRRVQSHRPAAFLKQLLLAGSRPSLHRDGREQRIGALLRRPALRHGSPTIILEAGTDDSGIFEYAP